MEERLEKDEEEETVAEYVAVSNQIVFFQTAKGVGSSSSSNICSPNLIVLWGNHKKIADRQADILKEKVSN